MVSKFVITHIFRTKEIIESQINKSVLQTERSEFANTLLHPGIRKTLRAGIVDQKGRRGAGHFA
jgi:hypothetical protein